MDPMKLTRQMIDFNKTTFDNSFNTMVVLQDQSEKMVNAFMEQATWLPEEGKKAMKEWLASYKKGREDFKKIADDSFRNIENYFASEAAKAK